MGFGGEGGHARRGRLGRCSVEVREDGSRSGLSSRTLVLRPRHCQLPCSGDIERPWGARHTSVEREWRGGNCF